MHFCPRDTCQTAWHRNCLLNHPIKKRPTCADRKLSLMCSIPSDLLNSPATSSTSTSPPSLLSLLSKQKSTQSKAKTGKRKRDSEADALSLFGNLPQDLVELASRPIIKPTLNISGGPPKGRKGRKKAPQEQKYGINDIAGNITIVLRARVLVNDVLRCSTILPRDWGKKIRQDGHPIQGMVVDDGESRLCPPLLCPTCGEHI